MQLPFSPAIQMVKRMSILLPNSALLPREGRGYHYMLVILWGIATSLWSSLPVDGGFKLRTIHKAGKMLPFPSFKYFPFFCHNYCTASARLLAAFPQRDFQKTALEAFGLAPFLTHALSSLFRLAQRCFLLCEMTVVCTVEPKSPGTNLGATAVQTAATTLTERDTAPMQNPSWDTLLVQTMSLLQMHTSIWLSPVGTINSRSLSFHCNRISCELLWPTSQSS